MKLNSTKYFLIVTGDIRHTDQIKHMLINMGSLSNKIIGEQL